VIDTIIILVAEHGDAYDEEYHEASLKHTDDMLEEWNKGRGWGSLLPIL
jgi:hypothetical protein